MKTFETRVFTYIFMKFLSYTVHLLQESTDIKLCIYDILNTKYDLFSTAFVFIMSNNFYSIGGVRTRRFGR